MDHKESFVVPYGLKWHNLLWAVTDVSPGIWQHYTSLQEFIVTCIRKGTSNHVYEDILNSLMGQVNLIEMYIL
jgi:phosphatidylinositol kinase/protein kinase (PI-3  family)